MIDKIVMNSLIDIAQGSTKHKTKYDDAIPYCIEYIQLVTYCNIPKYEALDKMREVYLNNVTKR